MLKSFNRIHAYFIACLLGFAISAQAEICLVMVIKNEELVIERTLKSVKDLVDCICICNAGSQDETLSLLHAFKLETGIPIKVFHPEGSEDPHTFAVRSGKKMLEKSRCDLSQSYLLFLEAGTLLTNAQILKDMTLTDDAYSCIEFRQILGFGKKEIHLLKASLPWQNQGRFYRNWATNGDFTHQTLDSIQVLDVEEESYTKNHLKQIIDLLKGNEDPEALFYLAQAYKAQHKYELAMHLHQNHIERGKNREQIWLSHYMIAECYEALQEWELALQWYLQAYQFYPERAEPLHKLAVHYRKSGENHLAYLFAKQGGRIPAPSDQTLWTMPILKSYQFDEELSIAAYYTPYQEEGDAAANDLLLRKGVPWFLKEQTYRNMLYYARRLENKRHFAIDFELPRIQEGQEEPYHPMNPSICRTEDGYQVICRTVNYTQKGAKTFQTSDPSGVFRTRNFLLHYDRQFNLQSQKEIIEDLPRKRIRSFNLEGLDDCRIFHFNKGIWFSCNTGDTNPFGNFQISLCKLGNAIREDSIKVEKLIPMQGPDPYRCEKNWLPFLKDNQLHFVYSYDPFLVYTPDIKTGQCEKSIEYVPAFDFSHFRGSAAPIAFDKGYLLLVHEVILNSDYSRCYLHRFLFLDEKFTVTKISKPFYFAHHGVEYCCSMTLNHEANELIIPIGIEDTEAHIYFFDCDAIRSLLYPLHANDPHVFSNHG